MCQHRCNNRCKHSNTHMCKQGVTMWLKMHKEHFVCIILCEIFIPALLCHTYIFIFTLFVSSIGRFWLVVFVEHNAMINYVCHMEFASQGAFSNRFFINRLDVRGKHLCLALCRLCSMRMSLAIISSISESWSI